VPAYPIFAGPVTYTGHAPTIMAASHTWFFWPCLYTYSTNAVIISENVLAQHTKANKNQERKLVVLRSFQEAFLQSQMIAYIVSSGQSLKNHSNWK